MITEDHIAPMLGLDLEALKAWNEGCLERRSAVFQQQKELL